MSDVQPPTNIDDEIARMFRIPARACDCDFCTGKKRWEDNWCARCGEVKLEPPKRSEDLDVCDACEAAIKREIEAEGAGTR